MTNSTTTTTTTKTNTTTNPTQFADPTIINRSKVRKPVTLPTTIFSQLGTRQDGTWMTKHPHTTPTTPTTPVLNPKVKPWTTPNIPKSQQTTSTTTNIHISVIHTSANTHTQQHPTQQIHYMYQSNATHTKHNCTQQQTHKIHTTIHTTHTIHTPTCTNIHTIYIHTQTHNDM